MKLPLHWEDLFTGKFAEQTKNHAQILQDLKTTARKEAPFNKGQKPQAPKGNEQPRKRPSTFTGASTSYSAAYTPDKTNESAQGKGPRSKNQSNSGSFSGSVGVGGGQPGSQDRVCLTTFNIHKCFRGPSARRGEINILRKGTKLPFGKESNRESSEVSQNSVSRLLQQSVFGSKTVGRLPHDFKSQKLEKKIVQVKKFKMAS